MSRDVYRTTQEKVQIVCLSIRSREKMTVGVGTRFCHIIISHTSIYYSYLCTPRVGRYTVYDLLYNTENDPQIQVPSSSTKSGYFFYQVILVYFLGSCCQCGFSAATVVLLPTMRGGGGGEFGCSPYHYYSFQHHTASSSSSS